MLLDILHHKQRPLRIADAKARSEMKADLRLYEHWPVWHADGRWYVGYRQHGKRWVDNHDALFVVNVLKIRDYLTEFYEGDELPQKVVLFVEIYRHIRINAAAVMWDCLASVTTTESMLRMRYSLLSTGI